MRPLRTPAATRGRDARSGATRRVGVGVIAVVALLWSASADAQLDTARFRSYTVATLIEHAHRADTAAGLPTAFHAKLQDLGARLGRPQLTRLSLHQLGDEHASFVTVARRRFVALTAAEAAAIDTLAAIMEEELPQPLERTVGRAERTRLLAPVDAFNAARRNRSLLDSREKLRRFERKYGPDAPTRNVLEVALNYGAQFVPGLGPNAEGWPSRMELIASYVPSYLALPRNGGRVQAVTVAEVGTRLYLWRDGWGGDRGGVLRPGFISIGAVAAGARDGALQSPLQGRSRIGAFVGWGHAKLAVIGGPETRVLVTRQVHLLPFVF